jgi:hypothetical protein
MIVALLVLARALIVVVPPYVTRFLLMDRMSEIARAPVRSDHEVQELLVHVVEEQGLSHLIPPDSFEIHTSPLWRRITCRYAVPLRLFPGVHPHLRFEIRVEQPFFATEAAP